MAILLIIGSVLIDLYIYFDIRRNENASRRRWSLVYAVASLLCWAFLGVCLLIPRRDASTDISFIMWGLYSYLSVYIPKFIFVVCSLLGGLPRLWRRKPLRTGLWAGLPLGIICFVMLWWGVAVTRHDIEVVDIDIYSPRLPAGFDGYRIAQISDLHTGTWGNDTRFIARLCDSVNACRPDVIFFTGDIVNRETRELQPFLKTLSTLHAPDGVYSILGNHDYGDYMEWNSQSEKNDNLQLLKDWQRQIGWKMLNNSHTELIAGGDTIQLIGVENWGEPPFHQYGNLIDAYPINPDSIHNLNDSRFKILLTHNPEHWVREVTKISNIDLSLSGHTHAMQIEFRLGKLKWSPAVFRYSTWGGLYERENPKGELMRIYVNIGAGEVGMPSRIGGAYPEITVITLHRGEPAQGSPAKSSPAK